VLAAPAGPHFLSARSTAIAGWREPLFVGPAGVFRTNMVRNFPATYEICSNLSKYACKNGVHCQKQMVRHVSEKFSVKGPHAVLKWMVKSYIVGVERFCEFLTPL
jgi:hypothetical protein